MRRLRRGRASVQKHVLILGTLALFSVLTIGYAAFQTNITLTAKGNVRSARTYTVNELKSLVVTSGDGLYTDPDETGRYVYKGGQPNNYLTLNNETWRIMSIEPDDTLKIIREDSIGSLSWDPGYATAISGITSANSTAGTRYSSTSSDYCYSSGTYYGCNSWGSSTTTVDANGSHVNIKPMAVDGEGKTLSTSDSYINVYLNGGTYLSQAVAGWYDTWATTLDNKIKDNYIVGHHYYNIGAISSNVSGQLTATDIEQEKAYKWEGRVGLITISEYVRASNNAACTGAYEYYNDTNCYNNGSSHNYLFKSSSMWTLSSLSGTTSNKILYTSSTRVNSSYASYTNGIRPVLYLSAGTKLQGYGTSATKYQIKVS